MTAAEKSCVKQKIANNNMRRTEWEAEEIREKLGKKQMEEIPNYKRSDYKAYKEKQKEARIAIQRNYRENQKPFYGTLKQLRQKNEYTT